MNPKPIEHRRRSIRLADWDYASASAYFVTVCTDSKKCFFGGIVNAEMELNTLGKIVSEYWHKLPKHFPTIELDSFTVMPNHVHFIIWLNPPDNIGAQTVGAQLNCAPTEIANPSPIGKQFQVDKERPKLGQVIRTFKAATARMIHQSGRTEFAWQRNYFEHIVRDENELNRIRDYIFGNPANWATDQENPAHKV